MFKPTYLYIKQHTITGKLYFGKTVGNPLTYRGSGLHWKHHIKVHGKEHVVTLWHELFTDQDECTKFALEFSEKMGIVKSDKWLNMRPEDGLMGGNTMRSVESYAKMAASQTGTKHKTWQLTKEQRIANSQRQLGKKRGPYTKRKEI